MASSGDNINSSLNFSFSRLSLVLDGRLNHKLFLGSYKVWFGSTAPQVGFIASPPPSFRDAQTEIPRGLRGGGNRIPAWFSLPPLSTFFPHCYYSHICTFQRVGLLQTELINFNLFAPKEESHQASSPFGEHLLVTHF